MIIVFNFNNKVSKWYELVVFTASMEIYGAAVADKLDNKRGILNRRYYRQVNFIEYCLKNYIRIDYLIGKHCTPDSGSYTKNLSAIERDLSKIFILDNSPGAYRGFPGLFYSLILFKHNRVHSSNKNFLIYT